MEVILALPSLPCQSTARVSTTTRLANRAKLRLLEDAMLDECEKEGDDEIIEDLTISKPTTRSTSSPLAVTIKIGIRRVASFIRRERHTSMPEESGNIKSNRIRSGNGS